MESVKSFHNGTKNGFDEGVLRCYKEAELIRGKPAFSVELLVCSEEENIKNGYKNICFCQPTDQIGIFWCTVESICGKLRIFIMQVKRTKFGFRKI